MNTLLQNELAVISLIALAISVVLTPVLRDVFRAYNVVDRPGFRRIHIHPIPRIGGIPIAIAYATALFLTRNSTERLGFDVWMILPGAALVFFTGLLDDFANLRPLVKLAGQIAAALVVFWSGLRIDALAGLPAFPLWLSCILTVFWLLLTTNALNLIDGLDGLCGGIGLLASLTMFGAGVLEGNLGLMYVTLPLVCALAGFLFYNFHPATVFLGDCGALLIGFLLGCYGMIWTQKTSTLFSLLVPLMALSVPLADVSVSIVRRLLRRQPIFSADRAHIHHRLLDRGLMPRTAVLWLYLFAAGAAGLALVLSNPAVQRFHNIVIALILFGFLFGLRELRYKEFHFFGRILFGGELQQSIQSKLKLDQLAVALGAAQDPDVWWNVLKHAAKDFRWARICWVGPRGMVEATLTEQNSTWTFLIPLGPGGSLQVDGADDSDNIDLTAFAAVVQPSARDLSEVR